MFFDDVACERPLSDDSDSRLSFLRSSRGERSISHPAHDPTGMAQLVRALQLGSDPVKTFLFFLPGYRGDFAWHFCRAYGSLGRRWDGDRCKPRTPSPNYTKGAVLPHKND